MRYVSPLRFEIVILRYAISAITATGCSIGTLNCTSIGMLGYKLLNCKYESYFQFVLKERNNILSSCPHDICIWGKDFHIFIS